MAAAQTLEELEQRIEGLEKLVSRTGLVGAGFLKGALRWRLCDKGGDGDMDPLTSTSWDGDSFSDAATGTINWNTAFGVPPEARAVFVYLGVRDSGAAETGHIQLYARSATTNESLYAGTPVGGDVWNRVYGIVPISRAGTSYYSIGASGDNAFDVYLRVIAYAT